MAEVSLRRVDPDGLLRAPVFVRLRDDVDARSVAQGRRAGPTAASDGAARRARGAPATAAASARGRRDPRAAAKSRQAPRTRRSAEARISLTNLDRVYWPATRRATAAITKRDLLRYLASVARFMLPHLADRPLTMIRMPEGIGGERFFQKHWAQTLPAVRRVGDGVLREQGRAAALPARQQPADAAVARPGRHARVSRLAFPRPAAPEAAGASTDYASSLAALEASILNYPDYLVFDIDPYIYSGKEAQGAEPELNRRGFAVGKRVAFWLRALLREMSLEAIVKTSGKTGLHVFVPIERTVTFDEARRICETVGRHVMRDHPKEITMEWAIEKRTGKIFIDYNMNVRGKTLNVAYSPRGVPGAPVSMPLSWEELEAAEPLDFTIRNVPARLEKTGDRWHDVLETKQSLTKAFGIKPEK